LPCKLFAIVLQNESNAIKSDTTKYTSKDWITTPRLQADSAAVIANRLLTEDSIFIKDWFNEAVFVNKSTNIAQLPSKIEISLIDSVNKFQLSWYGKLNSKYGPRWGKMHKGLDLYLRTGDTVVSAFNGVVRYAQFNSGGFGNCVVVRHTNGLETIYGHLSKIDVFENQYVQAGELLGLGGSTGHSSGPHLHFETRYKDFAIDPEQYYNTETGVLLSKTLVLDKKELNANRYPSGKVKKTKKGKKSKSKKKASKKRKTSSKSKTAAKKKTAPVKKPTTKPKKH
jgi:murein DD-endopeptidase MepM/ murein hydrolase activator NlpD